MPNDKAFSELGKAYAQGALEHLFKTMGGSEVSLSQLLAFQASAVSWLAASGFGLAIEKAGLDAAEHFLSIMMAGTSACIRLKGAPVLVTFQAKIEPVEEELPPTPLPAPAPAVPAPVPEAAAAAAPQEPEAAAASEVPEASAVCACKLVDGECGSCPGALRESYLEFATYLVRSMKETAIWTRSIERFCRPCGAKYADGILAALAREGISAKLTQEPEPMKQQAVAIALQTVQTFGLTEAPLTVMALRERQAQGQPPAQG